MVSTSARCQSWKIKEGPGTCHCTECDSSRRIQRLEHNACAAVLCVPSRVAWRMVAPLEAMAIVYDLEWMFN